MKNHHTSHTLNLLSAESISKNYNERWLFQNISLGIGQGDKIALVGANGAGKSTLLKIIAGLIPSDSGIVSTRKGIKVSYLAQQPKLDDSKTVLETIFSDDSPALQAIKAYELCMNDPDASPDKMQEAMERMEELKAWDYETKVHQVLGKLGIVDMEQSTGSLSGGQRKRLGLAQLLLSEPDLIILDEPTNHLDLEAIEWLEGHLSTQNTTLIMVTHDRYFLDNVTNEILELDRGQLYKYKGNYAYFLEKKAEREAIHQAGVEKAKNLLSKELEWMRRQPKARGTKAKYRIEAFYDLKEKASEGIQKDELQLDVKAARQGGKVIEIEQISKTLGGKQLVKDFTYVFKKQDRIGVVGKNGMGKSTFLNLITGVLNPDSGKVDKGLTTRIGYYTQETEDLNNENRLIDEVKGIAEYITLGNGESISVSKFLERFLFPPAMQYSPIAKLSGGERRRLQLLKVLVQSPNFLILDEPTNDLDIDTLNVLEEFLENFPGCLMLVSHDRYFMDKLVDHLFVFEGEGHIRDFPGNYSDYRIEQDEKQKNSAKPATTKAEEKPVKTAPVTETGKKRKLSFKELREFESLEKEIETLEAKKDALVAQLNGGHADHNQLAAWAKEIEGISNQIDEKTLRWLELSE